MIKNNLNRLRCLNNVAIRIEYVCGDVLGDSEKIARKILESQNYKVEKTHGSPKGIPDFICTGKESEFYVEVKSEKDSLRASQIEWILKNLEKPIIIFLVKALKREKFVNKKDFSGICTRCGEFKEEGEIEEWDGEQNCYPCLRKRIVINGFERRNYRISDSKKKGLFMLRRELKLEDLFEEIGKLF